jgi:hypothetical protein
MDVEAQLHNSQSIHRHYELNNIHKNRQPLRSNKKQQRAQPLAPAFSSHVRKNQEKK